MLLGDIISQYREEHKLSLQDFANLIGTSRSYIHMLEKNINPSTNKPINPSVETLKNLATAMNMNLEVLLKQLNNSQDVYEYNNIDTLDSSITSVPILKTVKSGYNYFAQENWIGSVDVNSKLASSGKLFALKIKDDSMAPVLIENDIVIVQEQDVFENGDIVVAIIDDAEATIKKVRKSDNGILLQPFNNNYEPFIFTYDEIKTIPVLIVGVVKQLTRDF